MADLITRERDGRQIRVAGWCEAAFGLAECGTQQRAIRLLEEALEVFQAAGCDEAMAQKLVEHVFDRPRGFLVQEIGGLGLCLLALAHAARCSADAEEKREIARVHSKPLQYFRERNDAKNAAGFRVP